MKFDIEETGRTVILNDDIVNAYCQFGEITSAELRHAIRNKYNKYPTSEEVNDAELSLFCEKILIEDMECLQIIPKALDFIEKHPDFLSTKMSIPWSDL